MAAVFSAIPYVSSGLALVAFVVAAILYSYRSRLSQRAKIIQSAPEADRVKAIAATAEFFNVNVDSLGRKEKEGIVLEQIRLRSRQQLLTASLSFAVAVLLAIVAIVAIVVTLPNQPPTDVVAQIKQDIETLSLADGSPAVLAAIKRLSDAGTRAESLGVCKALSGFVKRGSPKAARPAASALSTEIQSAVEALSALDRSESCRTVELANVDLRRLELPGGMLANATLTGSWLSEANLAKADLTGAELTGADLRESVFRGANLTGAKLAAADVAGANFADATGVCLKNSVHPSDATAPPEALQC